MRWSARRLRWMLLAGVLLLAGVVAGFFGVARWKAGKIWQGILARSGVHLQRETDGFTYSQSSGGRTVFTLHAAKATPLGDNRYLLHDAVLILYGRQPGRDDRISGKEIEYDQEQGVARAAGEVHMDLQVPEPGGKGPAAGVRPALGFKAEDETGAGADPGLIHVRTSGLVYMRKLGLAATGQPAEFRYGGMTCTSRGAEFDTGQSVVRLLAEVRMTGTVRDAPFTLTAGHAELSRTADTVEITGPVFVSNDESARGAHALLHLRKDGSVAAAEASGAVQLRDGMRTVAAPQMTAVFGESNRPEAARMSSGVTFADGDRAAPAQGSAGVLELHWGADGVLNTATATGAVRYLENGTGPEGAAVGRQMRAGQAIASFAPGTGAMAKKAVLQRLHLVNGAEFGSKTQAVAGRGELENAVSGDDLTASFGPGPGGRPAVRRLDGVGHTSLEQTAADGARHRSSGNVLEAEFAAGATGQAGAASGVGAGAGAVSSAVQTGHVEVESWAVAKADGGAAGARTGADASAGSELTTARAEKAVFLASAGTVTLSVDTSNGRAMVEQGQGQLTAPEIVVHQQTGDAEASGGVTATTLGGAGQAATHVLASRARLLHAADLSEFYGEAGRPVQLFQGGSQVEAGEITLDGKTHGMAARPGGAGELVEAVFATEPGKENGGAARSTAGSSSGKEKKGFDVAGSGVLEGGSAGAGRSAVKVSAARMDYDETHHEAIFTGNVRMRGVMGEVTGERGAAFLGAGKAGSSGGKAGAGKGGSVGSGMPDVGGSLERMVMVGNVRLMQPGRTGAGEQLTYTAATDNIVLTGAPGRPPRVTGEQGSVVTGATLVFRSADSTIVVAGTEGGPKTPGGVRVHTETDLKSPKNH